MVSLDSGVSAKAMKHTLGTPTHAHAARINSLTMPLIVQECINYKL